MTRNANTDLLSGVFGLAFTGFFWWSRGEVTHLSIMFPNALLVLSGVFSAALVVKGVWRAERRDLFTEGNRRRIVTTAAALFAWVLAIVGLGFYVGSCLVFLALTAYLAAARQRLNARRLLLWALIIALQVGFFDFVFARLLYVPLPRGVLF